MGAGETYNPAGDPAGGASPHGPARVVVTTWGALHFAAPDSPTLPALGRPDHVGVAAACTPPGGAIPWVWGHPYPSPAAAAAHNPPPLLCAPCAERTLAP